MRVSSLIKLAGHRRKFRVVSMKVLKGFVAVLWFSHFQMLTSWRGFLWQGVSNRILIEGKNKKWFRINNSWFFQKIMLIHNKTTLLTLLYRL